MSNNMKEKQNKFILWYFIVNNFFKKKQSWSNNLKVYNYLLFYYNRLILYGEQSWDKYEKQKFATILS